MKLTSEHLKSLHELYIAHLKKALDMEREITKALPTMVEKATTPDLATAFRTHLKETEGHVSRIEQILKRQTGKTDSANIQGHRFPCHRSEGRHQGRQGRLRPCSTPRLSPPPSR